MKKRESLLIIGIFVFFLPGCSHVITASAGSGTNYQIPSITWTKKITADISTSPTVSSTPTITSTIGPPPDLELVNPTAYPRYNNTTGDDYYILGRIRNNTDQTMVFFGKDIVFKFTLETWQQFNGKGAVYHSIYLDEAIRGGESSLSMNCILYPGDEGVYYYMSHSNRPQEDYLLYDEELKTYDGALGLSVLSYENFYRTSPELPKNLHLETESIFFTKEEGALDFDFNILNTPKRMGDSKYEFKYFNAWVILYDSQERIVDILYKYLGGSAEWIPGEDFQVHGSTKYSMYDQKNYWKSTPPISSKIVNEVNRIEVFVEYTEGNMCSILGLEN
jgi:hypothetical protein